MTRLIIGIDGGGSKTSAILADGTGRPLGRGAAGPSNYHTIGQAAALAALESAIAAAFAEAALSPAPLSDLVLGLAGLGRAADREIFAAWAAQRHPGARLQLVNDAEIVLAAGTPAGWGLAIIAGTGSLIFGRDPAGMTGRAGGWGYRMGDEGSAYAAGLAALQAVARSWDGRGPQTILTGLLLHHFDAAAPPDLIAKVYQTTVGRPEIAGLAPLVDAAALAGDSAARAILQAGAAELALGARAVATQLGFSGAIPTALGGGHLTRSRLLPALLHEAAAAQQLQLQPAEPVFEPVLGAIRLALAGRR